MNDDLNSRLTRIERGQRWLALWLAIITLIVLLTSVRGASGAVKTLPTPADAVRVMTLDAQALNAYDRPFMRYVWIPSQWWFDGAGYSVAAHVGNEIFSQSAALIAPHLIVVDDIYVVRYDLRLYATNAVQLQILIDTYEQLKPIYFDFGNVFARQKLTKLKLHNGVHKQFQKFETIRTIEKIQRQQYQAQFDDHGTPIWLDAEFVSTAANGHVWIRVNGKKLCHPAKYTRYTTIIDESVSVQKIPLAASKQQTQFDSQTAALDGDATNVDDVPLRGNAEVNAGEDLELAPELGFTPQLLPEELQTNVPAIRLDVLIRQAATTVDQVPFKGLYYDFRGIRGLSLDDWFTLRNVNPLQTNVANIPIYESEVTGRPRIVQLIPSAELRPNYGQSFAAVTFDTNILTQRNLSWTSDKDKFLAEALAHEVFVGLKNGMREYGIYDDQNQLASVPDVVAASRKIPKPHPTILAAPVDCWRCHDGTDTTLGYLTHQNDFIKLAHRSPKFRAFFQQDQILKSFAQLNVKQQAAILGDGNGADVNQIVQDQQQVQLFNAFDAFEQNAAQFFGDAQGFLDRARQDRDRNMRRASQQGLVTTAKLAVNLYDLYEYVPVTARIAAFDIGLACDTEEEAIAALEYEVGATIGYHDPDFEVLLAGGKIHRGIWERIYKRFAIRATENRILHRRGPRRIPALDTGRPQTSVIGPITPDLPRIDAQQYWGQSP